MKIILQGLLGSIIAIGAAGAAPPTDEQLAAFYAEPSPFESVAHNLWIAESENAYVIRDHKPQAPVHLLVIPKKRVPTLLQAPPELLGEMLNLARTAEHASPGRAERLSLAYACTWREADEVASWLGCREPGTGKLLVTLATNMALAIASGLASTPAVQAAPDSPGSNVVFVAHRGAVGHGQPENTLAAFRQAIASGAEAIEIDLRGTKDGKIVVMHDATVDRTTDGRGAVADKGLAELKKLDAGRGERIPTYEEVLQLVSGTGIVLLLDIKKGGVLDRQEVIRVTEDHDAIANVIVGPRSLEDLRAFRTLNPELRMLGFVDKIEDIAPFVQAGADVIRLWPEWIYANPGLVGSVHELGRHVWTTAGDAPRSELEKLVRLGVRGILVDQPAVLNELLADMKKSRGSSEETR